MNAQRIRQAVQAIVLVAVLTLLIRSARAHWTEFRELDLQLAPDPALIGASILVTLLTYLLLIEAWRRCVVVLAGPVRRATAGRIWVLANLGKYIPGKLWTIAGAGALARDAGLRPGAVMTAAVIMQVGSMVAGVSLVLSLAAFRGLDLPGGAGHPILLLGVALALLFLPVSPPVRSLIRRFTPGDEGAEEPLPFRSWALVIVWNAVAWLGHASAFALLHRGLGLPGPLSLPTAALAFTTAYIVGFLALFAPGGLGPRESMILVILTPQIGGAAAVALAAASRIAFTAADLIALALALPRSRK